MINISSFENAVEKYLNLVKDRNDDQTCLVWNSSDATYDLQTIYEVEEALDDFHCDGNHLVMWLTPEEAKNLYEQRQQRLKI